MSNKKKNAVKRPTSGKPQYQGSLKQRMDAEMQLGVTYGRIMEQQEMLVALKRIGVLGSKRIEQLHEALIEVKHDYHALVIADHKDDPNFVYSKELFDREFKPAVGEENFVDWETRFWVECYTEGIRSLELRRKADAIIAEKQRIYEEQQALKKAKEDLQNTFKSI